MFQRQQTAQFSTLELATHQGLLRQVPPKMRDDHYWEQACRNSNLPPEAVIASEPNNIYASTLKHIRRDFPFSKPFVYAPFHGSDVSHCLAFPSSAQILNLELDPAHVLMMRRMFAEESNIQSELGNVSVHEPKNLIDILYMPGGTYALLPKHVSNLLAPGGIIISHEQSKKSNEFTLVAQYDQGGKLARAYNDPYYTSDAPDSEIKEMMRKAGQIKEYYSLVRTLYIATGKTNNLLKVYSTLDAPNGEIEGSPFSRHYFNPQMLCVYKKPN